MSATSSDELARGFEALGLPRSDVVLHASLRSFGPLTGGARALIDAVTRVARNLVMPAFSWGEGSALVAPPPGDELANNGIDQGFFDSLPKAPKAFDAERSQVIADMGVTARVLASTEGALRSRHPLASWLALGPDAAELVLGQDFADPFYPLRRLCERSGLVVLAGVGLTSCTALHLAEERAGRRPFVRWALMADGSVRRAFVGGCSDGFDALWPSLAGLFQIRKMGSAEVRVGPIAAVVQRASALLRANPELSLCTPSCVRCRDAALGGPRPSH